MGSEGTKDKIVSRSSPEDRMGAGLPGSTYSQMHHTAFGRTTQPYRRYGQITAESLATKPLPIS
jgi:hypothetical protein